VKIKTIPIKVIRVLLLVHRIDKSPSVWAINIASLSSNNWAWQQNLPHATLFRTAWWWNPSTYA